MSKPRRNITETAKQYSTQGLIALGIAVFSYLQTREENRHTERDNRYEQRDTTFRAQILKAREATNQKLDTILMVLKSKK